MNDAYIPESCIATAQTDESHVANKAMRQKETSQSALLRTAFHWYLHSEHRVSQKIWKIVLHVYSNHALPLIYTLDSQACNGPRAIDIFRRYHIRLRLDANVQTKLSCEFPQHILLRCKPLCIIWNVHPCHTQTGDVPATSAHWLRDTSLQNKYDKQANDNSAHTKMYCPMSAWKQDTPHAHFMLHWHNEYHNIRIPLHIFFFAHCTINIRET